MLERLSAFWKELFTFKEDRIVEQPVVDESTPIQVEETVSDTIVDEVDGVTYEILLAKDVCDGLDLVIQYGDEVGVLHMASYPTSEKSLIDAADSFVRGSLASRQEVMNGYDN